MLFLINRCAVPEKQLEDAELDELENVEMSLVGEEIVYRTDSTEMKGYMAFDEADTAKRPGILVVHEWWGHNAYVRERADMLAELGYVAFAVDMYGDGQQAEHPESAMKFSGMVMQNMELANDRFSKAMELLAEHPLTKDGEMSAIGYCFGGSLILAMANSGVELDGVAAFHSGVQLPISPSVDLNAKVLVQNGADDPFISPESVTAYKSAMDSLGKSYEYIAYDGAVHAYTNKGADELGEKFDLPLKYNKEAESKSWDRLKSFLADLYSNPE